MKITASLFRFALTAAIVVLALVLGHALWSHYLYAPWTRDGRVRADVVRVAPDVSGLPSCAGATMCAQHLGRKPRQLYIIDLKAIPEPPAGSDADKIAKGEMAAP